MGTYKLKDDFVNGVLPNTNGKPNIIFKKGDIIDGTITEKFVFNTMMKGIMSKPTVVGARVEEAGGLVFVPITSIDLVNQPVTNANVELQNKLLSGEMVSSPNLTAEDKFYEMLGIRYSGGSGSGWGLQSRPVGRLLVAVVLVAGYFAYKKFKK